MIGDSELDRLLGGWLSEGGAERAPASVVAAAVAQVDRVGQKRPLRIGRTFQHGSMPSRWPPLALAGMAALLALALITLALAIGSQVTRHLSVPTQVPNATATVPLTRLTYRESQVELMLPIGWQEADAEFVEVLTFHGPRPTDFASISYGGPSFAYLCAPGQDASECTLVEAPQFVPYSASKTADSLAAQLSEITGSSEWRPAGPMDVDLLLARRLDVTGLQGDTELHKTFVIGIHDNRALIVSWVQAVADFDPAALTAVLANVDLLPGPEYSIGELATVREDLLGYKLRVPNFWTVDQPSIDGRPATGLRRFGKLTVSIGDADGTIGVCDPGCREVTGLRSITQLGRAVQSGAGQAGESVGSTTVDGREARFEEALPSGDATTPRFRHVYTVLEGRPIVLSFDVTAGEISMASINEIVASFDLVESAPPAGEAVFTALDGSFELHLPASWIPREGPRPGVLYVDRLTALHHLTAWRGDGQGNIQTCETGVAPWENCHAAVATTLDDLAAAFALLPIADHGVGPPVPTTDEIVLDGEPALVVRIQAYQYPARGRQDLAYVLAIHDGRPYAIRIWSPGESGMRDLDAVIAGFRFLD